MIPKASEFKHNSAFSTPGLVLIFATSIATTLLAGLLIKHSLDVEAMAETCLFQGRIEIYEMISPQTLPFYFSSYLGYFAAFFLSSLSIFKRATNLQPLKLEHRNSILATSFLLIVSGILSFVFFFAWPDIMDNYGNIDRRGVLFVYPFLPAAAALFGCMLAGILCPVWLLWMRGSKNVE